MRWDRRGGYYEAAFVLSATVADAIVAAIPPDVRYRVRTNTVGVSGVRGVRFEAPTKRETEAVMHAEKAATYAVFPTGTRVRSLAPLYGWGAARELPTGTSGTVLRVLDGIPEVTWDVVGDTPFSVGPGWISPV